MKLFLDSAGHKESGFIIAGSRDLTLAAMRIENACSLLCSGKPNCLVYLTKGDNCYLCRTDRGWVSEETPPASEDWILIYHQLKGVRFGKNELSTCQANKFAALDQIKKYRWASQNLLESFICEIINLFIYWRHTSKIDPALTAEYKRQTVLNNKDSLPPSNVSRES